MQRDQVQQLERLGERQRRMHLDVVRLDAVLAAAVDEVDKPTPRVLQQHDGGQEVA